MELTTTIKYASPQSPTPNENTTTTNFMAYLNSFGAIR